MELTLSLHPLERLSLVAQPQPTPQSKGRVSSGFFQALIEEIMEPGNKLNVFAQQNKKDRGVQCRGSSAPSLLLCSPWAGPRAATGHKNIHFLSNLSYNT